ncbi:MAG: apolipoprotein N-acyltransferase [Propionibacteriaceae bacterium]|jgi:apolipoprotein N-acyltransferase|nr:apolipoprotein N-acyltransferase [Propionibacteriaceae bacterium]
MAMATGIAARTVTAEAPTRARVAATKETTTAQARPARWQRWLWPGVCLLAGMAAGLGFQPFHIWPLIPLGVAVAALAATQARWGAGFARGYLFGLGMLSVEIYWIYTVAAVAVPLLIGFLALWYGLIGALISLTRRWAVWPLIATSAWVAMEWASSRVPFGGFGWSRLGFAAAGTPLDGLFPWISISALSAILAASGFLLAAVAQAWLAHRQRTAALRGGVTAGFIALSLLAGVLAPATAAASPDAPTVAIGVVQGNVPGKGPSALGRAETVTNNHLSETIMLAAQVRTGLADEPDFVLWPENATDIDPTRDASTAAKVEASVDIIGAPILVGAVTQGPAEEGERQTSALWWTTDHEVTDVYHKRNLVPFGERIPLRSVLLPLLPILERVGDQGVPGETVGVLDVALEDSDLRIGDVICFELVYDATVDEMITGDETTAGAEIVVVQTNNGTYSGTTQMAQQDAITQARALETGREIVVATTNSFSGLILADGSHGWRTTQSTADATTVTVPIRTEVTPAVEHRGLIEIALIVGPLVLAAALMVAHHRRRRHD